MGGNNQGRNQVEIIVNTRPKLVDRGVITYDEVLALAFDPVPSGPNIEITISWYRGEGGKSGDLVPNGHVAVHVGMVFDVTATDLS